MPSSEQSGAVRTISAGGILGLWVDWRLPRNIRAAVNTANLIVAQIDALVLGLECR